MWSSSLLAACARCGKSSKVLPCCMMPRDSTMPMGTAWATGAICSSIEISRSCSTARAAPTPPAIAHEADRLAVEFLVGAVERVLQHRARAVVVLGRHDDQAVECRELAGPEPCRLVIDRPVGRRPRLVEERQRVIAQVDELEGKVGALLGDLVDPVRGLFAEAAFSGRADHDAQSGLLLFGHGVLLPTRLIALALDDTNKL